MQQSSQKEYDYTRFLPLIIIFCLIGSITLFHQLFFGWDIFSAMRIMMASFFLIFGFFKVINLHAFVQAYRMYDIIAQKFSWYAYAYPFIELALGTAYLLNWQSVVLHWITFIIMTVSAIGVFGELRKGKEIMCACLGVVFKVPMTYVTLTEDLIMAAMAATMIVFS